MCKLSLYTTILCDEYHINGLIFLDMPGMFWHLVGDYEKRYIPKTAGLEIKSQAEAASVARCASNWQDVYIESVWTQ